jgi:hypothetical protein
VDLGNASAASCFSEMGGVVVEVGEGSREELSALLKKHGVPSLEIGQTIADAKLDVRAANESFNVGIEDLRSAHAGRLAEILYG